MDTLPVLDARPRSHPVARAVAYLLTVLVVGAGTLEAQPGPRERQERSPAGTIVADRPGIGNGAWVLPSGVFQVEAGVARTEAGPATLYRLGEGLLRYGLGNAELRAGLNSFTLRRNGTDQEGLEDLTLGLKSRLGTSSDGVMRISGLIEASVPTGSDAFTADEVVGSFALLADWTFDSPAGLSVNGGYTAPLETLGEETWSVTVTPTYSFPSVEGLGVYGGWAGSFPPDETVHILEAGLTYVAGADIQLDVNSGWDPESGDFFVGVGIARRWR